MQSILVVGIIIFTGFIFGQIANFFKLPRVTGYILAGVVLNPDITHLIPTNFIDHTELVTNIALSIITFSIGGSLLWKNIKKQGKSILYITIFEAEFAFLAIVAGFLFIGPYLISGNAPYVSFVIPLSILLGCLGSPTDPTATLAVRDEYKAKGDVTSTIMGVAAFDDVTGIINYSLAIAIAQLFILQQGFKLGSSIIEPIITIIGSIFLGVFVGLIFNHLTKYLTKEDSGGMFIVLVVALLCLCFGLATFLKFDQLLATMTMGAIAVNFNNRREEIFAALENYFEELVFVLFFTLSGMFLDFSVLMSSYLLVIFFVVFRITGKFLGVKTGALLAHSPAKIKKYVVGGLVPQGGIVIGLALMIKNTPAFSHIADIIISVIIGATVLHELIGPICAEIALKAAGEIKK